MDNNPTKTEFMVNDEGVKAGPLSDGELLDLLYSEMDKDQSTHDMGSNMAKLLMEHKQN